MVAQPVSHQIHGENGEQHRQSRKERDPPRGGQEAAAVGDHQPPGRVGRGHADAQEAQRPFEENHVADLQRRDHEQRRHHVGKDVTPDDPGARASGHDRQRDEVVFLDRQRLAADLPCEARPQQECDDEDDVPEAGLGDRDQHHRDQDGGQRQPDVGQAHEDGVGEAAAIAGDQPEQRAEGARHADGDERDEE